MLTLERWQIIGRSLTADIDARKKRKQPHAQEEALIATVKRNRLELVELDPAGGIVGLIAKDGSPWACLVLVNHTRNRIETYAIENPAGENWTAEALQLEYKDAARK